MKRIVLLLSVGFLVSGCYYKDRCIYSFQSVSCFGDEPFSSIQQFQKQDTPARTDPEKRWADAEACGAKRSDGNHIYTRRFKKRAEAEGFYDPHRKYMQFIRCMEQKGYVWYHDDFKYREHSCTIRGADGKDIVRCN